VVERKWCEHNEHHACASWTSFILIKVRKKKDIKFDLEACELWNGSMMKQEYAKKHEHDGAG